MSSSKKKRPAKKSETIILRVSEEMNEYLEELSKEMELSKSAIVRQMILAYRRF